MEPLWGRCKHATSQTGKFAISSIIYPSLYKGSDKYVAKAGHCIIYTNLKSTTAEQSILPDPKLILRRRKPVHIPATNIHRRSLVKPGWARPSSGWISAMYTDLESIAWENVFFSLFVQNWALRFQGMSCFTNFVCGGSLSIAVEDEGVIVYVACVRLWNRSWCVCRWHLHHSVQWWAENATKEYEDGKEQMLIWTNRWACKSFSLGVWHLSC